MMKTVLVVLLLILVGCAAVPGAPKCDKVSYERDGKQFKFYCEGSAGILGTTPL